MNKENLKATVLVYTIILTTVALILAIVVSNNYTKLLLTTQSTDIDKKLYKNISLYTKLYEDYSYEAYKKIHKGTGFTDNISCPGFWYEKEEITLSGNSNKEKIRTRLFNSGGTYYCSGYYNNQSLAIYFNSNYNGFLKATLEDNYNANLDSGPNYSGTFDDPDHTIINISENSYNTGDLIDDNFDPDN